MRADFFMCGIGIDARGFYTIKERLLRGSSSFWTSADSVVMNPA
jgi:hypothetical protein